MEPYWKWYAIKDKWQRVKCWVVGHSIAYGNCRTNPHDPDFCWNCGLEWPEEHITLYNYLNRFYVWMVERNWHWFNKLDDWLLNNHIRWIPSWWEY